MISTVFAIAFSALLALTLAHPLTEESQMLLPFVERDGVPVHGNWCGPFHGGSTTNDIPCVTAIDCKCRAHDLCYGAHGGLNCRCDNELVNSLRGYQSALAVTIRVYFALSLCFGPRQYRVPKICGKCVTIFGKLVCSPFPCGFTQKCKKVPIVAQKSSVHAHGC